MNIELDALISRSDRALDSMHAASESLATLRVVHRSADGLVTVEVDSQGSLVGLELADDLSSTSASGLESAIVNTAAAAAREALDRREDILHRMQSSLTDT